MGHHRTLLTDFLKYFLPNGLRVCPGDQLTAYLQQQQNQGEYGPHGLLKSA